MSAWRFLLCFPLSILFTRGVPLFIPLDISDLPRRSVETFLNYILLIVFVFLIL